MRSLLVKLTVENRVKFSFDIKQLNWDTCLQRWVTGVRHYIVNDNLSTLSQARKHYEMQVHKQKYHFTMVKHCWQKQRANLDHIIILYYYYYVFVYSYNTGSLIYPPSSTSHAVQVFQCVCVCVVWPVTSYNFCDTVQHGQHSVYYSVASRFNSHLFCSLCFIWISPFLSTCITNHAILAATANITSLRDCIC